MENNYYNELTEITVKTQEELDMIPLNFKGRIYIEFGTNWSRAVVKNRYYQSVVARGNSFVEAWGDSFVVAMDNSFVEAMENSSVVAWGNSSVEARGNSQIVDRHSGGKIEITGNARIVYMPKTIEEYCSFHGLKHDKKTGVFYKCVRKKDDRYISDKDSDFEYRIGEKAIPDRFDDSIYENYGHGIHVAYLAWALDYGKNWSDLAIIEVEAKLDDIVIPKAENGNVRCKEVIVLREVPLEECGVYGKILAKRRKQNNK